MAAPIERDEPDDLLEATVPISETQLVELLARAAEEEEREQRLSVNLN